MQQSEGTLVSRESKPTRDGMDRRRVERVVETLATLDRTGGNLAEVAHDARNMVTALGLYCDLLEEPGVLAAAFEHYGRELRLVAAASRRLVEKLVALDAQTATGTEPDSFPRLDSGRWPLLTASKTVGEANRHIRNAAPAQPAGRVHRWDLLPALPIANLAAELMANRNMLSALAGTSIALTMDAQGGALPVRLTGEDLTRLLVNLVKNASEALPGGGRIHVGLREHAAQAGAAACLVLTVDDNGPGIPEEALEKIFTSGYTTRAAGSPGENWPVNHRGLGLAITRSIVEASGGRIWARNLQRGGARIEIELPVRMAGV